MADGIIIKFGEVHINRNVLGQFLSDPKGQTGRRTEELTQNVATEIKNKIPVDTESLRAGTIVTTGATSFSGAGGNASITFVINMSALRGARQVSRGHVRLERGIEYAGFVNDRYNFVDRGIKAAQARNG